MKKITIALLGFGNVGRALTEYLGRRRAGVDVSVGAVADSTGGLILSSPGQIEPLLAHKEAGGGVREFSPGRSITSAAEFIRALRAASVPVLVESLPTNLETGQPALDLLTSALLQGTSVVTVDKGPLVHGFEGLDEAARHGEARLCYGGATGVRPPDQIEGCRILEILGVLNGTTNYILSEMQRRPASFVEALAYTRSEGIAEPDPSFDILGWDTVCKVLILARALMGATTTLAEVSRIGIGPETESLIRTAKETGRIVRLVGRARIWQGRVRVSVAPKLLGPDSPFYSVAGASKAAIFRTREKGEVVSYGKSGRDSISETIVEDIIRAAAT